MKKSPPRKSTAGPGRKQAAPAAPPEQPAAAPVRFDPRAALALAGLTLFALLLRSWALTWGAPNAERYYPYHPDEAVVLHAVCQVSPLLGDVAPSFYNYGSFTILATRLAYDILAVFAGWGPVPRFGQPFERWVADFASLLLVGRWLTVLLGALTVPVTYKLGERLYGVRAGWLAAGFVAAAPLPVTLGHYMTVDVPAAFFTTTALLAAAIALRSPDARAALIAVAGVLTGLAAGVKYNSAVALIAVMPALALVWSSRGGRARALLALGGAVLAAGAAFLVGTPGAVLEPERFAADLSYELGRNTEGQGLVFQGTAPAWLYHLGISLPVGLEWPLYFLAFLGAGFALRKRRPEDWLLLLFLAAAFLPLCLAERKFVRYVAPLVPPLALLAAGFLDDRMRGSSRRFWTACAGAAAAAAVASSAAHLGVFAGPDSRDRAAAFLREQSAVDDLVALGGDPWYYTPPIHPTTGCVKVSRFYGGPPVWDAADPRPDVTQLDAFRVLAPRSDPAEGALSVDKLRAHRPKRVVLSDYDYEDHQRLRRRDPAFRSGMTDFLDALQTEGYRLEREFRPRPSFLGFTWWVRGIPPHDWRYAMPTIRVYIRSRQRTAETD